MTVHSNQQFIGFRIRIDEMIETLRARREQAARETLGETIARAEQASAQREAQLHSEWLARALNEKA